MTCYITNRYNMKMHNGMKPNILTADSKEEFYEMVKRLDIAPEFVEDNGSYGFAVISNAKRKLAKKLGALEEKDAKVCIDIKLKMSAK